MPFLILLIKMHPQLGKINWICWVDHENGILSLITCGIDNREMRLNLQWSFQGFITSCPVTESFPLI